MGCDIHITLECRVKGKWTAVKFINPYYDPEEEIMEKMYTPTVRYSGRDYYLFNILAFNGVRVDRERLPFAWVERGIPNDVSDYIREEADGSDWHTHSHLTVQEIGDALASIDVRTVPELNAGIAQDKGCLNDFYNWLKQETSNLLPGVPDEDVRMVFWFDN